MTTSVSKYSLNMLKAFGVLVGMTLAAEGAWAAESSESLSSVGRSEPIEVPGQPSWVEFDAQAGLLTGGRLKVFISSSPTANLAVEGIYGGSFFASTLSMPSTFGAGVRLEAVIGSGPSHAWHLAPGLNVYFVPRQIIGPNDGSWVGGLARALVDVPTNVFLLSPNFDLSWMLQAGRHLGLVVGLKVGFGVSMSGRNLGQVLPDLGLYLGVRI